MAGLSNFKTLLLSVWIMCQINTSAEWNYWYTDTSSPALTSDETSPTTNSTSTKTDNQTNIPQISISPTDKHSNMTLTIENKDTSFPELISNETSPTTSIKSDPQITTWRADTHLTTTVTVTTKDSLISSPLTITSSTSPLVPNQYVTSSLPLTTATTSAVSSDTQTNTQEPEPPSSTHSTDSTKQTQRIDTVSDTSSPALTSNETSPTTSIKSDKQTQITTSLPVTHSNTTETKTTKDSPTFPPLTKTSSTSPLVQNQSDTSSLPLTTAATSAVSSDTQTNTQEPEPPSSTHSTNSTKQTQHIDTVSDTSYPAHTSPTTNLIRVQNDTQDSTTENPTSPAGQPTTPAPTQCKNDIKVDNCRPGYVCYQSDQDISFSLSSSNHVSPETCSSDNKTLCIKLGFNDYCSDLTATFTSGSCSLNLTTSITVDFLNPSDIYQSIPSKLPARIDPRFPPNCRNLVIDYTCSDEFNDQKKLSDLEPFTNYSCTGQIQENGVDTNKRTSVQFRVDCDLIIDISKSTTNTSIELSWDTTSQNCRDVLPQLKNLYYDCSCSNINDKVTANKQTSGGTCDFTELHPFTSYICEVQPKYNNKDVGESEKITVETKIGIPKSVTNVRVGVIDHNVITVKCINHNPSHFNGPENTYIARLSSGSESPHKLGNKTCDFIFRDLSYSTTYKLELTAFNGYFESRSWTAEVSTLYDEISIIRYLVSFIYVATSVGVMLYINKIYGKRKESKYDVNEAVMLETFSVYENPRVSESENTP